MSAILDGKSNLFMAGAVCAGTAMGCLAGYLLARRRLHKNILTKSSNVLLKVDGAITKYVMDHSLREPAILTELKKETFASLGRSSMMLVAAEESQFFRLILKMLNAKKTIEVGVFTGYNTLSMAMALPDDGKVVACDINDKFADVARRYWKKAGLDHKIDLRIQPAVDTLDELIAAGDSGTYDFVFIDADKPNYDNYYERALTLVRSGGIIALDNVLWDGKVADPSEAGKATLALRAINEKVKNDERVEITMLLLGDGVTLAMKN